MELYKAQVIAQDLIHWLTPACVQVVVAGSVRREKADAKDIELVAVPRITVVPAMFGVAQEQSELELRISELVADGRLAFDQNVRRNGPKMKKLALRGISVDLFVAERENFGNIFTIRTGSAEFSHMLVTPRRLGGLMPGYLCQRDGYLWNDDVRIDCPTEESFFTALGLPWVSPAFRDEAMARKMAKEVAR